MNILKTSLVLVSILISLNKCSKGETQNNNLPASLDQIVTLNTYPFPPGTHAFRLFGEINETISESEEETENIQIPGKVLLLSATQILTVEQKTNGRINLESVVKKYLLQKQMYMML